MHTDLTEIGTGAGAIISSIGSAWAWFNSIGLVPVFTFIAGAFFTLWTQERLEKKRRKRNYAIKMTEQIHGPLHKELNSALTNLRAFQSGFGASLETIMDDFRFDLVKTKLRNRIKEFQERQHPYAILLRDARRETETHILRGLSDHEIKGKVRFDVFSAGDTLFSIPMIEPIFANKRPLDYIEEKVRRYQPVSMIIVYVKNKSEGRFSKDHRIHKISDDILNKVREDTTVRRQRKEREDLIKECNSLIESIGKEIVL